ncbi:MAG: extracellular solute-binding protein [Bifidobacterium sp.]|jgi:raffinose/stachyose/melibiose transport system substrate-binding protein
MKLKSMVAAAVAAVTIVGLSACGSSGSGKDDNTIVFWTNTTTGAGKQYWEDIATAYQKKTGVKVKVQAYQNEDFTNKISTALQDKSTTPDIFFTNAYSDLRDRVKAGLLKDVTGKLSLSVKKNMSSSIGSLTYKGKIYGIPVSVAPGGLWYSNNLFKTAGIDSAPTTISGLSTDVAKLKSANITPIALGAKDGWPAAHWYFFFALRGCSAKAFAAGNENWDFSDSCWVKAADNLVKFSETNPFNDGYLTTSAQQGAGSSAGLVANHKAAMELMGAWDPGVMQDLTPDKKPVSDLGFFPFPSVANGKGTVSEMLSGVDGYVVSANASSHAADFLNFVANKENQEKYYTAFATIPASSQAQGVVTDSTLKEVLSYYKDASKTYMWFDGNVGTSMNTDVVKLLAGKMTPQQMVTDIKSAAKKG